MSVPVGIRLRRAVASDADLLLEWANDPETRAASFHVERIVPEEHQRWLGARLASPSTVLWIGELDGRPIGQVRLELDPDGVAEVGISVAPAARGTGLGGRLLQTALTEAGRNLSISAFVARVRPSNARSLALFAAAGFVDAGGGIGVDPESVVLTKAAG
jgi:RimJ/RimL family protein N-acetyltransferase